MTRDEWLKSADPQAMLALFSFRFVQVEGIGSHDAPPRFRVSDRKLRLFAVACVRSVWGLLTDDAGCGECQGKGGYYSYPYDDPTNKRAEGEHWYSCRADCDKGRVNRSRRAVEVAEAFADGLATEQDLQVARGLAYMAWDGTMTDPAPWMAWVACAVEATDIPSAWGREYRTLPIAPAAHADILRSIVGDPFEPVTLCGMEKKAFHNQYVHVDTNGSFWLESECPACAKLLTPQVLTLAQAAYEERLDGGSLDPVRFMVLADALLDAGCDDARVLTHLRSGGPFYRGDWVVDLLLGNAGGRR